MDHKDFETRLLEKIQTLLAHFFSTDETPRYFMIPLSGASFSVFEIDLETGKWCFPLAGLSGAGIISLCSIILGLPEQRVVNSLASLEERRPK